MSIQRGSTSKFRAVVSAVALAAVTLGLLGPSGQAGTGGGTGATVLASAPIAPDGTMGRDTAVLATSRRAMRKTWNEYQMPGSPPWVQFSKRDVLFVSNGEGSSCPEEFESLVRVPDKKRIKVGVHHAWGPICTDDWGPRSFVLAAPNERFPKGAIEARIDFGRWVKVTRR